MMLRRLSNQSARRVAFASAGIIILMATAGIVSTWRYDVARAQLGAVVNARADALQTAAMRAAFWQEREAMNEHLLTGNPQVGAEVTDQHAQFSQAAAQVAANAAAEVQARASATAAEAGVFALFQRLQGNARTTLAKETTAINQLSAAESGVSGSLNSLRALQYRRESAAAAAAGTAGTQALVTGILATILTVAAGVAFVAFVLRLFGRGYQRESDLEAALGRLGDRDELLARLRSTAGILGEVVGELRTAARSAAAATSEQSSAVAQTSATIEELATTAGAIADNIRTVSRAAERTGET